ncbi:MAG: alpha-hydroxy-acid oxidizing protein [Bacillota bacterium]
MGYGQEVQAEIEKEVNIPYSSRLPISYEEWERKASTVLAKGVFDYIAGGAGAEYTIQANREAFYFCRILPKVMVDVDERNLSVNLFGLKLPSPILLAPADRQELYNPEAELASARAAASLGVPFILSTFSTRSIEQVASVMGFSPRWFQLYMGKDPDVVLSMVRRAEESGYTAIVLTVDRPKHGWRERELRDLYPPVILNRAVANFFTDPVFLAKLPKPPQEDPQGAIDMVSKIIHNPSLTWKDLSFLLKYTRIPILVKGILNPDDAQMALDHGADGVIVSNHGGRHLDGAMAALDALPKVVDLVQGRAPILMDSGIRRGADVIKACALGASAVLVGRPYIYGLAVAGELGVRRVIRNLIADTDITMANSGRRSITEVDRSLVVHISSL